MKFINFILFSILVSKIYSQDSTKTMGLSEIVVTANFQESEIRKTARSIQVITAEQIALAPVKSLDGILQYALNVDVRSRGPLGVQADISLRGGHYDQTLIMVDGIKLNDPQTGHHSLNLPISLDQIERIEVLQGGASRVYGPSAFAGVIHLITKKNQPKGASLGITYGNFDLLKVNATANLAIKNSQTIVAAERISSDGYAYNTAFKRSNLYAASQINIKDHSQLQLQLGIMNNQFGASNFYSPSVKEQYEMVSSKVAALKLITQRSQKYQSVLSASVRGHHDFYDFNNYRTTNLPFVNIHQTTVKDLNWVQKLKSKYGTSTLGLEWRSEYILSNRLGDKLTNNTEKYYLYEGSDPIYYTKSKTRNNKSIYVEQWKQVGAATLSAGLLFNMNSQFGNQVFPGLDISVPINKNQQVYFSTNRSLRFPTFIEMYLTGATVIGDPNLKPEDAWLFETGVKANYNTVKYTATVFYKHSNNAIDKIKRPDMPVPTMEAIGNMNSSGLEFNAIWQIQQKIAGSKILLKNVTANYAYTYADKKEEGYQSFYTLNYLKHKATISGNVQLGKNTSLNIYQTYKKRLGSYQLNASTAPQNYKLIKLMDIRLQYSANNLKLFADVTNLFANKYYEFGFVELPGRWGSMGINYKF